MAERDGLFQVSLMNVFRQSARDRDARTAGAELVEEGRVLSTRSIERREGASQTTLREHLAQDLANLMTTIHLQATTPLDGLDWVRRSVLNYGMQDITRLTGDDFRSAKVVRDLREALLAHEPRLIASTLNIALRSDESDENQKISFDIKAEMTARPVDVPLEFVAEIDMGAGKVAMSNLKVRG